MSTSLKEAYKCKCQNPSPFNWHGEDSGLCAACTLVYDENLYERRLRQHVEGFEFETLDAFFNSDKCDPRVKQHYASVPAD